MALSRALFCQNAGDIYDAVDMRQIIAALADAIGPTNIEANAYSRVAAIGSTDSATRALKVVQRGAGANMSVDIRPGLGLVRGVASDLQGTYVIANGAVVNKAIAASDPTQDRIDSIYLVISDDAEDGSGLEQGDFQVVTGTPGAGVPANPYTAKAAWMRLCNVNVDNAVTSIVNAKIDDNRAILGQAIAAIVGRAAVQSIPNNATTTVTFDTVTYDPLERSGLASGGDATKIFLSEGLWEFDGRVEYEPGGGGGARALVLRFAAGDIVLQTCPAIGSGHEDHLSASYKRYIDAATYVQLAAYQDSGSAQDLTFAYLTATKVGL